MILDDVANPVDAAIHRGIEEIARQRGILIFAGSSDREPAQERALSRALLSRRVDGLVVAPAGSDQSYLVPERDAGVAIVFVDRPPALLDADCVLSDISGGALAATARLIAAGHCRIGYLGTRRHVHAAVERLRGHREGLAAHGVAYDPMLVRQDVHDAANAYLAVGQLLSRDNPPTALVCCENPITIGAINALRDRGLQHTFALVGFDDIPLAAALEPPLTIVEQDSAALGRTAAELLFARLDGDAGPSKRIVVPTVLVERGSGELPRA